MSLTSTESIIISIAAGVVGGLIATLMIDLGKIALDKFFGIKTGAAALVPFKLIKHSKGDGYDYIQKEFIRNRRVTTVIVRTDDGARSDWNIPWKDRKTTDYLINYSEEKEDDGYFYAQWELIRNRRVTTIIKRDGKKIKVIQRDGKDQSDWNIPWKDRKTTDYLINYSKEKEDDGHRYTQWEVIRDGKKVTIIVRDDDDAQSGLNIPWEDRKTTNYRIGKDHA